MRSSSECSSENAIVPRAHPDKAVYFGTQQDDVTLYTEADMHARSWTGTCSLVSPSFPMINDLRSAADPMLFTILVMGHTCASLSQHPSAAALHHDITWLTLNGCRPSQ